MEETMYKAHLLMAILRINDLIKKESGFLIYPNPTKHQINIEISEKLLHTNAIIYDMNGKEVQKVTLNKPLQTINIEQLNKGTYFINIENFGSSSSKKFIVE